MSLAETSDLYVMDEGYNSEDIYELIHHSLRFSALITLRNYKRIGITEHYRHPTLRNIIRDKVEKEFAVLKKKFCKELMAGKFSFPINEIKIIFYKPKS